MPVSPFIAAVLSVEARALLTRLTRVQPFALVMPMVGAARISDDAAHAIEHHLLGGRRELRQRIRAYLAWLATPAARAASPEDAQRRFAMLKLRFNAALTQFDIFADALTVRGEVGNGVWVSGLDVAADDALAVEGVQDLPPVVTYLDRGHGAAIRRARTRLPGGGDNPVAVVRVPRERMVGSGIAASLVHEVGHQGAAVLDLLPSLRTALQAQQRSAPANERIAWTLWERWISEIVADFWAVAKVGVSATQGLMSVVSLPRAFVFRIAPDDPHPFPWIRVKLSAAAGQLLYPDSQWTVLDRLWETVYPRTGLGTNILRIIEALETTMPRFVRLVASHRPSSLGGRTLARALDLAPREPRRLRALFAQSSGIRHLQSLPPTIAFAVLGQAKQDHRLSPERESRIVAELLTRWALARSLRETRTARSHTRALAA